MVSGVVWCRVTFSHEAQALFAPICIALVRHFSGLLINMIET